MRYSRREIRNIRVGTRRAYFLIFASILLLLFLVFFGMPAILNMAGIISNLRPRQRQTETGSKITPTTPRLVQEFDATRSSQIKISGVADPKVTIELFQNDDSTGSTLTNESGQFNFEVSLKKGTNRFQAQAVNDSGAKSDKSIIYQVSLLAQPPKLEVNSPKDGDTVKDSPINLTGTTDPEVAITVNDRLAIVGGNGNFSYRLNLTNGDNKIKITATDPAGNQTTQEITIKYNP